MSHALNIHDNRGLIARDGTRGNLIAYGTTKPTDGTAGYAPGCLWINVSAYSEATTLYFNTGTLASCTFTAMDLNLAEMALITGLAATAAELNRAAKLSTREVAAGAATLTVTLAAHDGKTILLDQATGTAVTLPAMTGSGARYRFVCSVATSGGSQVITATGAHLFGGVYFNTDTAAGTLFTAVAAANASGSTTITLDGSTKGGRKGDWIEIEDVATNIGIVRGSLNGSGTEATPFA